MVPVERGDPATSALDQHKFAPVLRAVRQGFVGHWHDIDQYVFEYVRGAYKLYQGYALVP